LLTFGQTVWRPFAADSSGPDRAQARKKLAPSRPRFAASALTALLDRELLVIHRSETSLAVIDFDIPEHQLLRIVQSMSWVELFNCWKHPTGRQLIPVKGQRALTYRLDGLNRSRSKFHRPIPVNGMIVAMYEARIK
jgi:hypothetical protein